jgi:hypothetical protein
MCVNLRALRTCTTLVLALVALSVPVARAGEFVPGSESQASGAELVYYETGNGYLESTVDVPGSSSLSRGGGRGGSPKPCGTYSYSATIDDAKHPNHGKPPVLIEDPTTGQLVPDPEFNKPFVTPLDSTYWVFTEVTDTTPVDNERQLQELLYRDYDAEGWHRYVDNTEPLDTLMRRFSIECLYVSSTAATVWQTDYQGTTDVSILDPFFQVEEAAARLRARIDLDPIVIETVPDESVWGGLVVNAPTHLSIGSAPWTIYTDTEYGRGVTVTQTASPRSLDFEVRFVPEDGGVREMVVDDIGCLTNASVDKTSKGRIPAMPKDFPEFAVKDPGLSCAWLPTEPGEVTIRARVVYNVDIHIGGRSERQAPYLWVSDPVTLRVDELIAVNTIGDG